MPNLNTLKVLQRIHNKGDLKGTFTMWDTESGSSYSDWYLSSTEDRVNSPYVYSVRFSDGDELLGSKYDDRLSCRPVRLVAVTTAPALG